MNDMPPPTAGTAPPTAGGDKRPSLYIVDALNFLFRAFHALPPLTTTKGVETKAVYGLSQMLLRIAREQSPSHICVVYDAPGRSFRTQVYAEYKAHRPPMPEELASQLPLVARVVDAFGIQTLAVPGFEADDVIATVTRLAVADGMEVVICSSDKDLMQLCDENVTVLDTMKNRRMGPAVLHRVEDGDGHPYRRTDHHLHASCSRQQVAGVWCRTRRPREREVALIGSRWATCCMEQVRKLSGTREYAKVCAPALVVVSSAQHVEA